MLTNPPSERTGHRILAAVADEEDVDPLAMEPPLGEVIDTRAVAALVGDASDPAGESVQVTFTYRGHDVVVSSGCDVEIQ